jgi:ubiquinone/menaquinone biosynthesis C-methylase UbiE
MGTERYVIQGGVEGRERLRLLSEVMGLSTRDLLAIIGISPGSICLDVVCGGGDVTFELARAVGSTGRVVGVDLDETKLDIARREAEQGKLLNIVFESRDVTEWKPSELFDVVYARFLLTHLPNPRDVICAMRRSIRPGGVSPSAQFKPVMLPNLIALKA